MTSARRIERARPRWPSWLLVAAVVWGTSLAPTAASAETTPGKAPVKQASTRDTDSAKAEPAKTAGAAKTPVAAKTQPSKSDAGPAKSANKPTSQAEKKMLELNEAGFNAFAAGDFVEAAKKFEKAHDYVPDPILRKNAAIAWFKADRCKEASRAAVFFLLADEMNTKDRIEARSVLGHCRLEKAERDIAAGKLDQAAAIIKRVAYLETDKRVHARLKAARMNLVHARAETGAPPSRSANVGWVLVGTGAAILAGNIAYHLISHHDQSELDSLRADHANPTRQLQLQDNLDTAGWLVPTLYGVGAVTTGTGLWLVVSGSGQETQKPVALRAPAPSVQVGWTTTF